jgi:hypothetical protein
MQGAQNLRSEAYLRVRCNDEGEAQRRRWTFYETIKNDFLGKDTSQNSMAQRRAKEAGEENDKEKHSFWLH